MLIARRGSHRANAGSQTFTCANPDVNETGSFTVPSGVIELTVSMAGGGGGGGGNPDACAGGGGGGSGGYYDQYKLSVVPFQVISWQVGKRGVGGGYIFNGTAGGNTTFGSLTTTGGGFGQTGGSRTGGTGGSPNGRNGVTGPGGAGGSCGPAGSLFGTGGTNGNASGYGAGGNGAPGCYYYTCGDNRGCPGTAGFITVSW